MEFKTALATLVKNSATFTLLTAPMGWGKTRLVWNLLEDVQKIVFFCPLRSIVEELQSRENVFCFLGDRDREEVIKEFWKAEKGILVVTVESFPWILLEELVEDLNPLFVLDEFHLFYEWGRDFRPKLFEIFKCLVLLRSRILSLTATAEEAFLSELKDDLSRNDITSYFIDLGNFQYKYDPRNEYTLLKDALNTKFLIHCYLYKKGRIAYFFKTKKELYSMKEQLRRKGVDVTICVGGKVKEFVLQEEKQKRVILATSALSHGVNIRNLRKIFLSYHPPKYLRYQMIGRGGRFGEGLDVYELAKGDKDPSLVDKIKRYINNLILEGCSLFL